MLVAVGVIGLGVMGSAMSAHLVDSADIGPVAGYDVDPAAMARHRESGGIPAGSVAELAERSEVIVTSLPSVESFEEVVGQLVDAHAAGVVVETSTLPLAVKLDAGQRLSERGAALLDCPLSGTGAQARTKDLVAYISGDEAAKARACVVLGAFTRAQHDAGEFGNGTKLKLLANLLVAVHNVAAAEALLLAQRAGLDLDLALRALGDGAGSSRMLQVRGPMMLSGAYDDASVRLEVFGKDVDIIAQFAAEHGSPTPLFSASAPIYRAAIAEGRAAQDAAAVFAVLQELAREEGP